MLFVHEVCRSVGNSQRLQLTTDSDAGGVQVEGLSTKVLQGTVRVCPESSVMEVVPGATKMEVRARPTKRMRDKSIPQNCLPLNLSKISSMVKQNNRISSDQRDSTVALALCCYAFGSHVKP